nr:hypothetical protein [Tanacetum cinerariifolium]
MEPLPTIDPKDKGKGVLEELENAKNMTRSYLDVVQIAKDAEIARLVYEEELAELEKEKEKRQREEEASKAAIAEMYDEVQAGIKVDTLFVAKLQHKEREEAAQRSVEIKSRPPTKSQLRNLMMTYIKNMDGYKYSQLKAKTFVEIQVLYKRQKMMIDDFKPIDLYDVVDKEKVLEEPENAKIEVKQEGDEENIRKRSSRRLKMKATNKHRVECIYYGIFRFDGSSTWIKTFLEMVTRFDRMDLEELYNLVMEKFEITSSEGVDLVLWGDLRTMFEETTNDDLWRNQKEWILKSWNFYENSECKSEAVFDLLRFIQKQIDESGSHDGSEKDLKELASPKQTALGKDI